jgi:MFS family permease
MAIQTSPTSTGDSTGPGFSEQILFWASFLTLIAAGIGFSVRGAILGDWSKQFGFTQGELGTITGGGLVGFGITIIVFSFIADRVGYGPLMGIAFFFHLASALVTMAATAVFASYGKDSTYWCLYIGAFLFALGNGTCEAVINPLTATLYPKEKTHWLNILHAGWPGGLIIGALLGLAFEQYAVRWEYQMAAFLVPTLAYGALMVGRRFPKSEAAVAGVTMEKMREELGLLGAAVVCVLLGYWLSDLLPGIGNIPGYVGWLIGAGLLVVYGSFSAFAIGHWMLAFLLVLHALVGYVELGTDSWITNITSVILENKTYGLMLFIWTSGLMFALRFFAGPIVHQISPLGLLFASACLGCLGLVLLGSPLNTSIAFCVLAATIYGCGKTFLWPTMLGVVSERFPKGGALALGAIGGVGMLSAGLMGGPGIGYKQDYFASTHLEAKSKETYERYVSRDDKGEITKKGFLTFPPSTGLDGTKVGTLMKPETLTSDLEALKQSGRELKDDKNLDKLTTWWEQGAKEASKTDMEPVKEARLHGGKMALTYTAIVPGLMAIGYLLLILYFRAIGGYKAEHIDGGEVASGHGGHGGPKSEGIQRG